MSDGTRVYQPPADGTTEVIDTESVTYGGVTRERQIIRVAGSGADSAEVRGVTPGPTDHGLVVRPVPEYTQPAFGRAVGVTPGAIATVATLTVGADFTLSGFVATGNGDGYFVLKVSNVTVLTGRINISVSTLDLSKVLGNVVVASGTPVSLEVRNEASATCDYEGVICGG